MCRVRRISAAQARELSITASSSRTGNNTFDCCCLSFSKAACTSRSTHELLIEFSDSTSNSLS